MDLAAHETLVRLAERRVRRASEKRAAAVTEEAAAIQCLQDALTGRADWIASNTEQQMTMI